MRLVPSGRGSFRAAAASITATLALVAASLATTPAGASTPSPGTYTNPVSKTFADTFADPSIIRGRDGWWYAYGTSDPLRSGEAAHVLPTARSQDMVTWSFVGDAFTAANRPTWAAADSSFWAPDIRYFAGSYHLYFVATQTTVTNEPNDNAIGVATAPTPAGPWSDSGAPVVGPRHGPGGVGDFKWTFDPAEFTAPDGSRYLYYGSYYGGIWVTRMSADGLHAVGTPTMAAIDNKYEGAYVVRHGSYYYLMASSGDCCAGPTTGYSVFTGRSTSPLGPFIDANGVSMTASRTGGSIVITPNGNNWVGTGHNAVATDAAGQDWLVYHAIDHNNPYLNEPFGINRRPMLIDRLDWIGGWPVVRAGQYASQGPQPAPATSTPPRQAVFGDLRVRAAVRTDPARNAPVTGTYITFGGTGTRADVFIHQGTSSLVMVVRRGTSVISAAATPLPAAFAPSDWHDLAVEARGSQLTATVSDDGLHDPLAMTSVALPAGLTGGRHVGALTGSWAGPVADLTAAPLYQPVTKRVSVPSVGPVDPAYSDDFNATTLSPDWSWVRTPDGQETGGSFVWPTQNADLFKDNNSASVLLRNAPPGDYTVETKLAIDLGVDTVRNFQQAGLIAYVNDDNYLRFDHVAIWNTRQTEFGKEMPYAGQIAYGSMTVGPPADVTWLRLTKRTSALTGEQTFRASISRDGRHWTWGGSWTLPADAVVRIGLVSHGGTGATALFDYFRVHRP